MYLPMSAFCVEVGGVSPAEKRSEVKAITILSLGYHYQPSVLI
jgi:hypothetical protein